MVSIRIGQAKPIPKAEAYPHDTPQRFRKAESAETARRRRNSYARHPPGLLLAAGLLLACESAPAPEPVGDPELGAEHYADYCALCHGEGGEGYVAGQASALASRELQASASDAFLAAAIRWGRPGSLMSAWSVERAGPLDEQAIVDLVAYLRSWQQGEPLRLDDPAVTGEPERGAPIYAAHCSECHGRVGEARGLSSPAFLASASDAFIRHAIAEGRDRTPMPGYSAVLTPQAVDDLVALIRSWQEPFAPEPLAGAPPLPAAPEINPEGVVPAFELGEEPIVAADDLLAALEAGGTMVLVDARPPSDYVDGHLAGAVSLPFYEAEIRASELPLEPWFIVYAGAPGAGDERVYDALVALGHTRAALLDSGYPEWLRANRPVAYGPDPQPAWEVVAEPEPREGEPAAQ